MVLGWRRAFCTSIPPENDSATLPHHPMEEELNNDHYEQHGTTRTSTPTTTPKFGTRFPFFTSSSNPSTPRLRCQTTAIVPPPSSSLPASPKLQCQTKNSPRFFHRSSNPSSPRSPSPFSFLKSSLRLNTRRCGLCLQSVRKGQGMATFTAECSHGFHFPCISDHVKRQGSLACPVCSCLWKEMPLLSINHDRNRSNLFEGEGDEEEEKTREKLATSLRDNSPKQQTLRSDLKVYNDDEPLASLTPKARFIPIPESDENCDEEEEFRGFYGDNNNGPIVDHAREVEVRILPETAAIAASRRHETYAIVLRVKAPTGPPERSQRRAPIDLVTVVDVSGRTTSESLPLIKRAMRTIVSSLSSSDRLSIVAFSSYSKRLMPLRRMTTSGRRSARRIVEAMAVLEGSSNSKDAVKKAVKVLEDRRERNSIAAVILLSEIIDQSTTSLSSVTTTRFTHSRIDIPIHSIKLAVTDHDELFAKFVANLLAVVVQDLRIELGFVSSSSPAAIAAVYSRDPQPIFLGTGTVRIGELSAGEERELLVELKLPSPAARSRRKITVRCCYKESSSQEIIYGKPQALDVPLPTTVRSSSPAIQRLRNVFITTRALAESRRLTDRNDLIGAYHMLVSARALMQQSNPAPGDEFVLGLEAELSELQRRRTAQGRLQRRGKVEIAGYGEEKSEPLTPTSAWRVADKLAKVAMMRKSVNRVSDLHGFEDARF